jgi:RNA-directed DNA polymerase
MSPNLADTQRPLHPPIAQRHLETEVANCVGGVISPLLANLALSALDDHFARSWQQTSATGSIGPVVTVTGWRLIG